MNMTAEQREEVTTNAILPCWYDGQRFNEVLFCSEFLKAHPMVCVNGSFFTVDGLVHDEDAIKKEIYESLKHVLRSGATRWSVRLMDTLRLEAYTDHLPLDQDRIHVANGTLYLNGRFAPNKTFCRNRLPVAYRPDAAAPETWLRFLDELLEPEDILTLQEYMGYCFLPTTRGQTMLLLKGSGGEGKSRIGLVMRALLGSNLKNGSIAKVEQNAFARADLEHQLVMVDDDMQMEALKATHYLKSIITAETPMDLERKGVQSYQGELYVSASWRSATVTCNPSTTTRTASTAAS